MEARAHGQGLSLHRESDGDGGEKNSLGEHLESVLCSFESEKWVGRRMKALALPSELERLRKTKGERRRCDGRRRANLQKEGEG